VSASGFCEWRGPAGALLGRQRMMKSQAKDVQLVWISNEIIVLLAKPWPLWPSFHIRLAIM
jgi:hypothetical protein